MLDEYGRDSPRHSTNAAIVLAVDIPPHAPLPWHAFATISRRSSSVIRPASASPYDWNADTTSSARASPRTVAHPARVVPPYTIRPGRFSRPRATATPGRFLSHPGIATTASYQWAATTVSNESAIRSRDGSE